jgi:hypothetical protein
MAELQLVSNAPRIRRLCGVLLSSALCLAEPRSCLVCAGVGEGP